MNLIATEHDRIDPRICHDGELGSILNDVRQMGHGSQSLIHFMNRIVEVSEEVNESARTSIFVAFRLVRELDTLPAMEFELRSRVGETIIVDSNGQIVRQVCQARQEDEAPTNREIIPVVPLAPEEDEARLIAWDQLENGGLASIQFEGYRGLFQKARHRGLNLSCIRDFVSCRSDMAARWETDKLFQFYVEQGSEKWIAPLRDFISLEPITRDDAELRHVILDAMVNAGRLGFCPTQFLRRVIEPQIDRNTSARDNGTACGRNGPERYRNASARDNGPRLAGLRPNLAIFFEMAKNVHQKLQAHGGDGSAANIVTVKYFIHSLAQAGSKLYLRGFYDERGSMREIFMALAASWAEAMNPDEGNNRVKSRALFAYVAEFIQTLVAIETPYEIESGFERASRHLLLVARGIGAIANALAPDNFEVALRTFKPMMQRRVFHALKEKTGGGAQYLKFHLKHMDIIERYLENGGAFGPRFAQYLVMLSHNVFESPEDVDFYFQMQVHFNHTPDAVEFLAAFMKEGRESEGRKLLLEFMAQSPLLESSLYETWKELEPDKRPALLEYVNRFMMHCLYNPTTPPPSPPVRHLRLDDIETAVITKLVRSSQISKILIAKQLAVWHGTLPPIPNAFHRSHEFEVERLMERDLKSDAMHDHENLEFLHGKARLIGEVSKRVVDRSFKSDVVQSCEDKVREERARLEAELKEAEAIGEEEEDEKTEKRVANLTEQKERMEACEEMIRRLAETRIKDPLRQQLSALILTILGSDKKFHKRFAEEYARMALASLWTDKDEIALSMPPYSDLEGLDGTEPGYTLATITAMNELFYVHSQTHFAEICSLKNMPIPPAFSVALDEYLRQCDLDHLVEAPDTERADFFSRQFRKFQGEKQMDGERRRLQRVRGKMSGANRLKMKLVAARTRMDQFYGHVGENCTSAFPQEIKRKEFIPVRIIDAEEHQLVGYIHLMEIELQSQRSLFVPGIEPKTSFLSHIDAVDFYVKVEECLIAWAKSGGYSLLLYPTADTAQSNNHAMHFIMNMAMDEKTIVNIGNIVFPRDAYLLNRAVVMWSDSKIQLPFGAVRYGAPSNGKGVFFS